MLSHSFRYLRVIALATIPLSALGHAFGQDLAIVDAKFVESSRTVEHARIIVRNGRIAEVGPNAAIPDGMQKIEGAGMTLYPGFIDAYSTTGVKMPEAPTAATRPASTSSAPANMWDKNRANIRARVDAGANLTLSEILSDAHKAGFTSALIAPFSGYARGQCVWTPISDPPGASRPYGMAFSFRGGGGGGGGGGGYPGTTMASYALLRQTMFDAQNPRLVGTGDKADPDLSALQPSSIANGRAVFALDADNETYRAMKFCEEFGLKLTIAGGKDAFRRATWFAESKTPVLVSIALGTEPSATGPADGPPKAVLEERLATWKERSMNVLKLDAAKADYAFSSDGDSYTDFLTNVRKIVAMGLSKESALRAMTESPAKILGVWNETGSIEVGKRADFVLMSGDVFTDGSTVKYVVVGGKSFDYSKEEGR